MYVRKNNKVIKNTQRPSITDLDSLPFPAYELIDMDIYMKNTVWGFNKRSINIITSRGCPYNCTYCYHIFGRSRIRFRSAENIRKELEFVKKEYQVDFVALVDDNATVNKKRLYEIFDVMKDNNVEWGCHGRVDTASPELFETMKISGCKFLGFGIESGSSKILKNINKKVTKEQISKALRWQKEVGFSGNSYIFGSPGENIQTIFETAIFCAKNKVLLGDMFTMTAYPGTPLFEEAVRDGRIKNLEDYVVQLGNADKMIINFSDFPDFMFGFFKRFQVFLTYFFNLLFNPLFMFKKIIARIRKMLIN